ncbi:hypothetical protein A2U01_0054593, partial [Trifolium medium]|nr:hypothetical protein [Trifolium medium]
MGGVSTPNGHNLFTLASYAANAVRFLDSERGIWAISGATEYYQG